MEVYRAVEDDLVRIPETELDREEALENHLVKSDGVEIGGVEVMYVGRQGRPSDGGIFDILGVDENGDAVIVELKRDKSPREIVAQALEYASGIRHEDYSRLDDRYREFRRTRDATSGEETLTLREAHRTYFTLDEPLPEQAFNTNQRLVLVATDFRDVSLNMADFLREHDVDVVCVEYDAYATDDGELELVTTDAIRRPLELEPTESATDDSPEYSDLIYEVRDRVFSEIKDVARFDSPDEMKRSGARQLGFKSQHPEHPVCARYGVVPTLEEDGHVTVRLNVWGGDDDTKDEVRTVVANHVSAIDGFELTDDYENSMVVLRNVLSPEDTEVTEELVESVTAELVRLVEFYHPKLVEQVSA